MHCGYIVEIKELRPHTNADRLQIATFFGYNTCVSLEAKLGDIGIYFPSDLQLGEKYCIENHLLRKLPDGTPDTGYLDPNKRNVQAIKLRGERSDGIFMPLTSLSYLGDINELKPGMTIDVWNGEEICRKYIPQTNVKYSNSSTGNRVRKKKTPIAPLFIEHADTEQLAYNLEAFKPGDEIEITLKMHGTSQRTAYLPIFKNYKRSIWDRLIKHKGTPIYDWGYVSGTRRTVLENYNGGYYGSNEFREVHSKFFEGKLWKGEEVYYEVVGFTHTGAPIMASCNNKKLNDKEFVKQYGETTTFSYGCSPDGISEIEKTVTTPAKMVFGGEVDNDLIKTDNGIISISYSTEVSVPQSDIYVYRMTMTNEDGNIVEYTPDFMRYRCEQMGVKCVPLLYRAIIPDFAQLSDNVGSPQAIDAGEYVKKLAEDFYDGPDPIGRTHVREGVVVRIVNRPKFCAYKHKNWFFRALEGIVKVEATEPDMEEAENIIE